MRIVVLLSILTFALTACTEDEAATGGKGGEAAKQAGAPALAIPALGLKVTAPEGTTVSKMLGNQMLEGPGLVASVGEAGEDYPKSSADAVKEAKQTYDGMEDIKEEALADGWIFSAENKGGSGTNYWVQAARTIGGKRYKCETTASSPEQQANAIAACKSLRQ